MFYKLPSRVQCDLLSSWLHIETVAQLDSACCGKANREEFLQLCQRKGLQHVQKVSVTSSLFMLWLIKRQICLSSIEISVHAKISLLATFFSITGETLRSVTISHLNCEIATDAIACFLSQYCRRMIHLQFHYCTVDIPTIAMLVVSSTLVALRSVKINFCGLSDGNLLRFRISPLQNVRDVTVAGCTRGHEHIEKLMMLFPAVLVLELNSAILTDKNLIQIVGECPKVNVIVLYNCKLLTEESLQIAVQRWDLEGMVLRRCGIYSDQLLRCICDHGSTFTSAGFVSPSTFTNSGIVNLIRACPKLNNIALGWHPILPVEFVDIIAPKLGNLEILVLAQGLCCDVVFNAVGKHCARLEVLDIIDDKLGTCIASGAGLVFLLES